jgi:hypothetical protein
VTSASAALPTRGWRSLAGRFRWLNLGGFALAGVATLLLEDTGPQLLVVVGLAAVTGAAAWGARRWGLPESALAAPATALAFAAVTAGRAAAGAAPYAGATIAGLLVFLQTGLALWDIAAARPLAPTGVLAAAGAVLGRRQVGRVLASAGLAVIAARGVIVGASTTQAGAWACAALALAALGLLWRRASPQGTLLAALLLAAIPGALVLGCVTRFDLWAPLTRSLAACLWLIEPRPGLLLGVTAVAGALSLTVTLLAGAGEPDAAAPPTRG